MKLSWTAIALSSAINGAYVAARKGKKSGTTSSKTGKSGKSGQSGVFFLGAETGGDGCKQLLEAHISDICVDISGTGECGAGLGGCTVAPCDTFNVDEDDLECCPPGLFDTTTLEAGGCTEIASSMFGCGGFGGADAGGLAIQVTYPTLSSPTSYCCPSGQFAAGSKRRAALRKLAVPVKSGVGPNF